MQRCFSSSSRSALALLRTGKKSLFPLKQLRDSQRVYTAAPPSQLSDSRSFGRTTSMQFFTTSHPALESLTASAPITAQDETIMHIESVIGPLGKQPLVSGARAAPVLLVGLLCNAAKKCLFVLGVPLLPLTQTLLCCAGILYWSCCPGTPMPASGDCY